MGLKNAGDFYPLSPMQQGMLFHTLYAPASGVYFEQMSCTLQGNLNVAAFERAWQQVVDAHPILRTAFVWEGFDEPVQVVQRRVDVPFTRDDLRELTPDAQQERLAAYLHADRDRGFDLAMAPLMRLALFQLADDAYQLVWSYHHLLLDGWSMPIVMQDVFTCYEALEQRRPARPERRRPYRDYIVWLRQQNLADAEAFWRRTLDGLTTPTPLGIDIPAGDSAGVPGDYQEQHVELSPALTAALSELARRQQLTLNTLFQGAWALLLSRYSGEEDVVFGATVSGRPPDLLGAETMVGLFINTLPVRVRVTRGSSLLGWLSQLQAQQAEMRQYEYSPLVQIQSWSAVSGRLALFESILVFENYPVDALMRERGGSLAIRDVRSVEQTNYPLTLVIVQGPALTLRASYDRQHFEDATIARVLGHLQAVLECMVADLSRRLADVSILTANERQQLLVEWNATWTAYPRAACTHELIVAQAARTPDAIAVIFEGQAATPQPPIPNPQHPTPNPQQLTYSELDQRASRLARYLRGLGVGPEVRVALCVERSLEMAVGLLAILKAGGAYVPLDPAYPHEHLSFMLDDSRAAVVLTQRRLGKGDWGLGTGPTTSPQPPTVVYLDADLPQLDGEPAPLAEQPTPDNLAYVIYTSGSTGRPKGVMIAHRAMLNLVIAFRDTLGLRADDRFLMVPSLSFDASVGDIFPPLICGGALVVHRAPAELAGSELRRLCERQRIAILDIPAAFWAQWVHDLAAERSGPVLGDLKLIIVGGESIAADRLRTWAELTGRRVAFFGPYGPTEATVCTTFHLLPGDVAPPADAAKLPIGRPIANAQVYLLDRHMQPVPVGVPGEIAIGGDGLARGYLGRPELTAERFVPNPFGIGDLGLGTGDTETRRLRDTETGDKTPTQSSVLSPQSSSRLYRTGDVARYTADGTLEFLGRVDQQVKVRGYRIELEAINAQLRRHPAVRESAVTVREDHPGDRRLVAYVVLRTEAKGLSAAEPTTAQSSVLSPQSSVLIALRAFLHEQLPDYMVPSAFVLLDAIPVSANGKLDRQALPAPPELRPELEATYVAPRTTIEQTIAAVWQEVLHVDKVGIHDNFFDLGGHSLLMIQVHGKLREALERDISLVELFKYPSIHTLARYLSPEQSASTSLDDEQLADRIRAGEQRLAQQLDQQRQASGDEQAHEQPAGLEIAIVGMAGRFPGARTLDAFWQNLCDGVEAIAFFSDQELLDAGVNPALLRASNYVKAGALVEDIELFDAGFFGYSPKEAELMDPQQRLFLECAWEAIEGAGYNAESYAGAVGVYAGVGFNGYWLDRYADPTLRATMADFQTALGNDRDFLTTRVAYKLNLRGPGVTVQTACSTSLVAVYLACQSLLSGACDMALAGGVSLRVPQKSGYLYHEGGILSPDGHCRAFDAHAQGTIFGSGMGIVVLKRLADALADGDQVHAVIKGVAINNDGSAKVGYTAPGVDGQAQVIRAAQMMARIDPETVTYIEAHGTGTPLGDPIEIAALAQAFQAQTSKTGFCAIGSVKTNIGHLDVAAGAAGLIKTVLALKHRQLPPSLHFEQPNPVIDFAHSPFYVNTALSEWTAGTSPRRAGVSSFGIGGTNAHVVVEEAPEAIPSGAARPWQLLLLSARSDDALAAMTANLVEHLKQRPSIALADVAYTLQVGRKTFDHRRMLVCRDRDDAIAALETLDPQRVFTASQEPQERPVVFLFPGQGAQYVGMAAELYREERVFSEALDRCAELLRPHLGIDLRDVLYGDTAIGDRGQGSGRPGDQETRGQGDGETRDSVESPTPNLQPTTPNRHLDQTEYAQPALFAVEYALAQLWMSWGVRPRALIGHSIGEYVAACLAGVFSLDDALALVALRGRLMQALPHGAMLSVALPESAVRPLLGEELSLAAVNSPSLCVVSGSSTAVAALHERLAAQGVESRRLHTSHAFHSAMVEPMLDPFTEQLRRVRLQAPAIPYISNVSGTWISAEEATDPRYWARHLREPVRFAEGLTELLKESGAALLEVGPGRTLSTFARQHPAVAGRLVLTSLRHPQDRQPDIAVMLRALGQLWMAGAQPNWAGLHDGQRRLRVGLPTYPFERRRYWLETQHGASAAPARPAARKRPDIADWFSIPTWQPSVLSALAPKLESAADTCWLLFADACGLSDRLAQRFERQGQALITVVAGTHFAQLDQRVYAIDPQRRADYDSLIAALRDDDMFPQTIVHAWSVTPRDGAVPPESFEARQSEGFYSLLFLAQALETHSMAHPMQLAVLSSDMQPVNGEAALYPEKATLLGPCKVIPQEYPNITCRSIDVALDGCAGWQLEQLADRLAAELAAAPSDLVAAYRGGRRWTQTFEPVRLDCQPSGVGLRDQGVYMIAGGFDGMGRVLADHLVEAVRARFVLVEDAAFPARDEWECWLAEHREQDEISRTIRAIQALEQRGAEVLVARADIADDVQMRAAISQAEERFGAIHGVIYTESLFGEASAAPIRETGPAECDRHFRAKAYGLFALERALQGRALDFCVVQSSLAALLGGLGSVAYAAAALFVDAFAYRHNQTHPVPWISVNWDVWRLWDDASGAPRSVLADLAIAPDEGVEVFRRILAITPVPQIVVSTGDLQERINQWIHRNVLHDQELADTDAARSLYPRPQLPTAYMAPRNEVERLIADAWQKVLGIDQVGVYDDFFELGGHSLVATQLRSRLADMFQVDLPLRSLFETPTVAGLAVVVAQKLAEQVGDELLTELAQLSQDEVQTLLATEQWSITQGASR